MLPSVIRQPFLMWRQPTQKAQIDIGIITCDIDVPVMDDGMLPKPEV